MLKATARGGKRIAQVAMKVLLLVTLALSCARAVRAQSHPRQNQPLVLDSRVTLLEMPGEASPVRRAIDDLADDFYKVLGTRPKIVTREEDAGPLTILIGEQSKLPAAMQSGALTAAESFSIGVSTGQRKAVVLSGADMRGTIYAVYQFSEQYLGVDPLYYWTDHEPLRRARIVIPASSGKTFPAPVFKYRGFFLNDEDLLTGWAPGEKKDHTGISLEVWNKIYETILRLKGNMVVPGTWIFPNDPQVKLASDRGLIVN
jgi:hypothetical protein